MKFVMAIMAFSLGLGQAQAADGLLKIAIEKTGLIYAQTAQLFPGQLATENVDVPYCMDQRPIRDQIVCSQTDLDDDLGWVSGLEVIFSVERIYNNQTDNFEMELALETVKRLEH